MQNSIEKFIQSSIVLEKPGTLSENLKTLTSSSYLTVQYFFAETSQTFCTYQCLKTAVWDFFISFRSWVVCKNKKRPDFYTLVFYTFISSQDLNKIKKIPHTLLQTLLKRKRVQTSSKKNFKIYGSWSSSMFSIFHTKNLVSCK